MMQTSHAAVAGKKDLQNSRQRRLSAVSRHQKMGVREGFSDAHSFEKWGSERDFLPHFRRKSLSDPHFSSLTPIFRIFS
jgi:hypothetical protein